MRKVLFFMIIALVGCATDYRTDYRISRLKKGMSEDSATSVMGTPDRVERRGEYVVLRYEYRPIPYYPDDRADYYVIVENGLVVDYGAGLIRSKLLPPEERYYTPLGTIGVVPALFLPEIKVDTPGGWEKAASRGMREGADEGEDVLPYSYYCVTVPVGTCIGCFSGLAQGPIRAVPDDEVEEMRSLITDAIAELNIQETISAYVSKTGLELTDCDLELLKGEGPSSPDEELNYSFLKGDGIDSVLEVSVRSVGFKSGPGRNPKIIFFITVYYRFIRIRDEKEIFSKEFTWFSHKYPRLADYVEDDSRLLREEFDLGCRVASEIIVKRPLCE